MDRQIPQRVSARGRPHSVGLSLSDNRMSPPEMARPARIAIFHPENQREPRKALSGRPVRASLRLATSDSARLEGTPLMSAKLDAILAAAHDHAARDQGQRDRLAGSCLGRLRGKGALVGHLTQPVRPQSHRLFDVTPTAFSG